VSVLNQTTLVLTKGGVPTSVVPWWRGAELVYEEKAFPRANYDYVLHNSRGEEVMPQPSVVQCTKSNFTPKIFTKTLPLNRYNIYLRDAGHCMYCGRKVSFNEFTFDHVTPQCEGGLTIWENVVVCCTDCNGRKGSGDSCFRGGQKKRRMLLRQPYAPRLDHAAPIHMVTPLAKRETLHKTWDSFIYWHIILEP
jgi:hypothetical protein